MPRSGRRDLDDRLFRFDCEQRLIGYDVIAFPNVPSDNFGLAQAFAKVREVERSH
jgi:hypothetical protein